MEAIRATDGIEFILVSNEASGGFMADVCWRLTGSMAACFGTFGPGACNLTTGVCCGFLDRSPMLAFTDEMNDRMRSRISQMNIDHQALFAPITKWTTRLSPGRISEIIRRGADWFTQLGTGDVASRDAPAALETGTRFVELTVGAYHGCAITDADAALFDSYLERVSPLVERIAHLRLRSRADVANCGDVVLNASIVDGRLWVVARKQARHHLLAPGTRVGKALDAWTTSPYHSSNQEKSTTSKHERRNY